MTLTPPYRVGRQAKISGVTQRGKTNVTFSAEGAKTGTIVFPVAFTSVPVVTSTVEVGSNLDVLVNWQNVSTTQVGFRAFNKDGTAISGTATIHWSASSE